MTCAHASTVLARHGLQGWLPKAAEADGELTTEWGRVFGATSEQQRPNSRENRASSGTRRRSQALLKATLYGLQNLHPRFKSGRRLQFSGRNSIGCAPEHKRMPVNWTTVDYRSWSAKLAKVRKSLVPTQLPTRELQREEVRGPMPKPRRNPRTPSCQSSTKAVRRERRELLAPVLDRRTKPVLVSSDSPRRRLGRHGRSPIGKLPGIDSSGA
jgi:hypothetical protein